MPAADAVDEHVFKAASCSVMPATRELSRRFWRRIELAAHPLGLDVGKAVRLQDCDDQVWPHSQLKGALFAESATNDRRWMVGAEGHKGDFTTIACWAAEAPHAADMLLTLGLGGATELPSHRLIQSVDPVFALADRLRIAGFGVPMVRIFKADSVAAEINRLDRHRMEEVSRMTMAYIRAYATRFYPSILPHLSLCTDDLIAVRALMEEIIRPMSATLEPLEEMTALGRDRSTDTDAMAYGIAHAFHMGALLPLAGRWRGLWQSDIHHQQPRAVICIGGKPERLFIPVMKLAAANAGSAWRRPPRLHLITRLGHKPAYAPYPDEPRIDVAVNATDVAELGHLHRCGADWKAMRQDKRFPELLDFTATWAT
jgi:hypothetical protein